MVLHSATCLSINFSLPMIGYQNISRENVTIGIPGIDGNRSVTRDILYEQGPDEFEESWGTHSQ